MKALPVLLCLSAWIGVVSSQNAQLDTSLALLSPCALKCFFPAIQTSQCQTSNVTCICTDETLHQNAESCLLSSCTIKESLGAMNITAASCGLPIRDSSDRARATYIPLTVVALFFACIRIVYKSVYTTTRLTWDDYMLSISALLSIPSLFIADLGVRHNGCGRDIWTVPFDDISRFLFWLYIMEILYITQVAFIKLTMLFFFLRVFPNKTVQTLFKYTVVFTMLYGIVFCFTAIFQCQPIHHFWNSWDGEHRGHCINVNGIVWVHAAINILLDIWMLAIPLHQVFHLQLSWQKKISITLMFFVGTFVTVVSIIRLHSLVNFGSTRNPTWDQTNIIIWSVIEINVAIMCICMPTLRVMLARLFPHVKDTFNRTESQSPGEFTYSSRRSGTDEEKSVVVADAARHSGKSANEAHSRQSFEAQHADIEEVELMSIDGSGSKRLTYHSTRTSQVSTHVSLK